MDGGIGVQRHSTYLFSGGGTGGHLFPGIAVAEELLMRNQETEILFVGSERRIERKILAEHQFNHFRLSTEPVGTLHRNPFKFLWRNQRAYRTALQLLLKEKPEAVIGLGGFASVPVALAATSLQIPTILLEQNSVPGRATRWLSRSSSLVCLSFPETLSSFRTNVATSLTGNPVRKQIGQLSNQRYDHSEPTLLVLGGSQGAHAVNEVVTSAITELKNQLIGWKIVHQTGVQQLEHVRSVYQEHKLNAEVQPFFSDLSQWYQKATLVISRAGATTLAELACCGTPAVLIPYPNSVGDHQLLNARSYEACGSARILEQQPDRANTRELLTHELSELISNPDTLQHMRNAMHNMAKPNAAVDVVNQLERVVAHRKAA